MITWLFTQVWLWSLAAFALGALITWLLFVRPLQRRLAEAAEHPDYDYDYDRQPDYDEPDTAREPLELLQPARPRDPEEPPIGDWDRPPRAWADPRLQPDEDTDNTWFRKWAEEAPEDGPGGEVTAVQPRIPAEADTWTGPENEDGADTWVGPNADRKDDTWVGPNAADSAASWASLNGVDAEDTQSGADPDDSEDTRRGLSQVDSAEPETPVRAEAPQPAASFSGQLEDADRLSGQLRSLFESEQKNDAHPETPYVPPVGAEATQVMPAVTDDEDVPPLPQRTPGAGPHPGRDHGWSGPMVKGHSASRQYHTPESPQYDDIVADVWFRSAKDAEIAGFTSWNGN